ncbi:MAG: glycogen/starch/alpha-glucan phosphorylase, partial [Kiritimatiellia bacterium]|nr:glycogen/starch/alpha-glucan phosphorylase [Kiritimatiellia bacterium]
MTGKRTRSPANAEFDVTEEHILNSIRHHIKYTRCKNWDSATMFDKYESVALAIRDLAVERMITTQGTYYDHDVKRVYYLSMEFLMGRLLFNNIVALKADAAARKAIENLGIDFESLCRTEEDAGLGNGGLGRLAACFLDSMATTELPAYGYGIRYEHGMFRQEIENGWQRERPDDWLKFGYPWEMVRPEYTIPVLVYGHVENMKKPGGATKQVWVDWQMFEGLPYDIPIIGYDNNTVNFLRLWSSRASEDFRLDVFNQGDYVNAMQEKNWAETVTRVLYPSDNTNIGKELRLIQEYFLVACSTRDIIRRFQKKYKHHWDDFPKKNAIQLNDTHPALAIVELMRFFVDEIEMPWEKAWELTTSTFAYTNHTIMPEALEKWPIPLIEKVLPRHMQIIYEINYRFLQRVTARYPGDLNRPRDMSLIEESKPKQARMANLAIVGSHSVNGVSELHSRLLKTKVFRNFAEIWPKKFSNKTNGITQRRWLLACNPNLAGLISGVIGNGWIKDLDQLRRLEPYADDGSFQNAFREVKLQNKMRLAKYIYKTTGINVEPSSFFDVQIKRLHEYKRQLLNALHIITLYHRLKANPAAHVVPRTFIFGAKAAPSYTMAKHIIKLITGLGERINNDSDVNGRLKVVFLPDYEVSLAELIVPAADLSEQISTAGMEASGTGNMKLALNGALTIGTWDGANIEIAREVGLENVFIFGYRTEQLAQLKSVYNPLDFYNSDAELKKAVDALVSDEWCADTPSVFAGLHDSLMLNGDHYFVLADFRPYVLRQKQAYETYKDPA